ncbi:flavin-containing monooxygenase 9 [Xylariales sp. PMI_506]|nr:flavin-containing monooxygenase 9 [Xylariales sp. PMI_506]
MQGVAPTVAVIGAGPTGLAALKCLLEEGFAVTGFEARFDVGGIWNYSPEAGFTTCLKDTLLNSSKFISHYSDFPFPEGYPNYPPAPLMHKYFQSYAEHFDLTRHIKFDSQVTNICHDDETNKWVLRIKHGGKSETRTFDKVVVANGMLEEPVMPTLDGAEAFKGIIMHGRDYKNAGGFKDANVLIVGIGNTAADIAVDLRGTASTIYLAHRRGALVLSRFRLGRPIELSVNYHTLRAMNNLEERLPSFSHWVQDYFIQDAMKKSWEIDPSWGLGPVPSLATTLPCVNEGLIPGLAGGSITSVRGLHRFVGPKSVELDDGTVLENIDAVIFATGYSTTVALAPWVKRTSPPGYRGRPMPRLYLQIFPPDHKDSIAFLSTCSATDNIWALGELCSMAIAQLWSGKSSFPSRKDIDASIEKQLAANTELWKRNPSAELGVAQPAEFYDFLHRAAGTGLPDMLGWGWKGWQFWWVDRKLCGLMGWGIPSPFAYRVFDIGKRKAWDGAREALRKSNEEAQRIPAKSDKFRLPDGKGRV